MTAPAKALQIIHVQRFSTELYRNDMVYHGGGSVLAMPCAFLTHGVAAQFGSSQPSPSAGCVEAACFFVPVAGIVVVVNDGLVLITV